MHRSLRSLRYISIRHLLFFHRGSALPLALFFVLLLSLLAAQSMQTSTLELKMADNYQRKSDALLRARSISTVLHEQASYFPLTGAVGYRLCPLRSPVSPSGYPPAQVRHCDAPLLVVPDALSAVPDGVSLDYEVVRQKPLWLDDLPFRQAEYAASSMLAFDVALFEIRVQVDGRGVRAGRSEVVEGIARLVPANTQPEWE
ncbi:MAG: PilX N-terminal domain-containing pilus assembly protein [Parahaliea sp.]